MKNLFMNFNKEIFDHLKQMHGLQITDQKSFDNDSKDMTVHYSKTMQTTCGKPDPEYLYWTFKIVSWTDTPNMKFIVIVKRED